MVAVSKSIFAFLIDRGVVHRAITAAPDVITIIAPAVRQTKAIWVEPPPKVVGMMNTFNKVIGVTSTFKAVKR